ncbi:MAG: hypothetical protein WCL22_05860 [bacterium]
MKNTKKLIVTAGVISVGMMAAAASADFGTLTYGGTTPIAFTVGNGGGSAIGNDGYRYSNHSSASGEVTIGLKAIAWQGANFDLATDVSYSSHAGGGTWLNTDSAGAYLAGAGVATETRDGSGNIIPYSGTNARWSFVWSATVGGARPNAGLYNMRMIDDGPAAGSLSMDLGDLNANFGGASDPHFQNAWNVGWSFMSSAGSVNDIGNWNIKIQVFNIGEGDGYSSQVGEQAINVLVPAPGAFALIGVAGLTGGRRRRA